MPGPLDARLGAAQLQTLRRMAASPRTPPAVARRARVVLTATGHATAPALPVGPATAARWVRRFLADGTAGLADRPRPGRPPADRDAAERPLLLAPLLAPTAGWTSRTVAELTGRSQAAVARAWTRTYTVEATGLGDRIPAAGLRLVAAAVTPRTSVLVLTPGGPREHPSSGPFMRSPRRPPLQTLLAADLLASSRATPSTSAPAASAPVTSAAEADPLGIGVVRATRRQLGGTSPLYVLSRRPLGLSGAGATTSIRSAVVAEDVVEVVVGDRAWQGLLADLVRRCTGSTASELLTVQHLAMAWARSDRPSFEWTAFERAVAHTRSPGAPSPVVTASGPRSAGQALADDVLAVLLTRITSGRLAAGSRVPESSLTRAVHASRSQVRDALRVLAAAGLLDLEPHRGAVVPTPQTADVVETYAARRAVGALVVRRAAHWTPGALDPVERALDELVETGRTGDSQATGEADLRFQDALAGSTGMRRIPRMFCDLTAQLRLFIAVMGLDYTYSIPGMCHDDTMLLEHIRARDETGAARIWHRKIDDAVTSMTTQLHVANAARRTRRRP